MPTPQIKKKPQENKFGAGLKEPPFDPYGDVWPNTPETRSPVQKEELQWIHQPPGGSAPGSRPYLPPHTPPEASPANRPQSMKRGGMIHRTAIYRLHKGERVLPKSMARSYREAKCG